MDALLDVLLRAPPPPVRHAVLKTLNRMRRNVNGLRFDPESLEPALLRELRQGYQAVADATVVEPNSLLARTLAESQAAAFERTSRVLGLVYPLRDVLAAYQGLTSDDPATRSAGLELLENVLSLRHRSLMGPLADPELSIEERARRRRDLLADVAHESREAVLERLARQADTPWLAAVAAATAGRTPLVEPRPVPPPFHLHPLPRVGVPLRTMISENGKDMLKLVERADFLRDLELFTEVRTEDLAKIAAISSEREYAEGERLFAEGDESSELFLIVSGQVRVSRRGETAFTADRGETVGTLALIDARPREFTATATRNTRTLVIERDDFYDLLRDHFDLVDGLLTHLTRVVRKLNEQLGGEPAGVSRRSLAAKGVKA